MIEEHNLTEGTVKITKPPRDEDLRDRFAMAAIQGFCSQCDATGMWSWQSKDVATFAYEIADAVMEVRKK